MLIQLTTPRIAFDATRAEKYYEIHTLCKPRVSTGDLHVSATNAYGVVSAYGEVWSGNLPHQEVILEGDLVIKRYVLPFWKLYGAGVSRLLDGTVSFARELIALGMHGYKFTAHSAFRDAPGSYSQHVLSGHIFFPVSGGGVLRISDTLLDIRNPTFEPFAPSPEPDPDLPEIYSRMFPVMSAEVSARRAARIASVDPRTLEDPIPALPPEVKKDNPERLEDRSGLPMSMITCDETKNG